MHELIILFSFYGLTFAIKESSLLARPRMALIKMHPFFFELLNCYFCTGWYAGLILYLLNFSTFSLGSMITWGFSSAAISFLLNLIVDKLSALKEHST
jgi:hypothetical protein